MTDTPLHQETYTGQIILKATGEADESIRIVGEGIDLILAEEIEKSIDEYGRYATARYWYSERQMTAEEMKEGFIKILCGFCDAEYDVHYSGYTGYLWTDEELTIGGHDLLDELREFVGSYIHLEIEFSREPKQERG